MRKLRIRRMRLEMTSGRRKIPPPDTECERSGVQLELGGLFHFLPGVEWARKCVHCDLTGVSQFATLLKSLWRHNGYWSNMQRVVSFLPARRPGRQMTGVEHNRPYSGGFLVVFPQHDSVGMIWTVNTAEVLTWLVLLMLFSVFMNNVAIYALGCWRAASLSPEFSPFLDACDWQPSRPWGGCSLVKSEPFRRLRGFSRKQRIQHVFSDGGICFSYF